MNYEKHIKQILPLLSQTQLESLSDSNEHFRYDVSGQPYVVMDSDKVKICASESYKYIFDKTNGNFTRWGKTYEEDPEFSPVGPEIADIEISINGCPNACSFCYKSNTNQPATNMSLDTFKGIINKYPKTLTQVAFGITGIQTNPDFIPMMEYCREIGIVPNFTLSGIDLTDELAEKCAGIVGALAVSAYQKDKDTCYNTVKRFTDLGVTQTNIHLMVSKQTLPFVYEVLTDRLNDDRLKDMNAIVFLGVKPKGRAANGYEPISTKEYRKLIDFCFANHLAVGFDSCSAGKFEAAVKDMDLPEAHKKRLIQHSESCESSLFSSYINTLGEYWHCSFAEEECGQNKVSVLEADDFVSDVWYSDAVMKFREESIGSMKDGCRYCTIFDLD